ncbi:MAG: hypothetical protein BWK80_03195 [Desulfobacteraceae bacterium IS3]|nr:MAG: hypothetical protein BWK80_03195 [Desulfobacteraceae bacterium IS3]
MGETFAILTSYLHSGLFPINKLHSSDKSLTLLEETQSRLFCRTFAGLRFKNIKCEPENDRENLFKKKVYQSLPLFSREFILYFLIVPVLKKYNHYIRKFCKLQTGFLSQTFILRIERRA